MTVSSALQGQDQPTPTLDDHPFATAMTVLGPMAAERRSLVGELLLTLANAHRHEVVDFTFGDKEIYWGSTTDPQWLAMGYDGGESSVTLLDSSGEPLADWEGEDAWPLLRLGRLAGRERNDSSVDLSPVDELYLAQREV